MVYERFDYPFIDEVGIPDLNLPPITIDGRHRPHKISHYTPDMLPYAISVDSENYFSTLITPSDSQDLPPSSDRNPLHVMKNYATFLCRVKIVHCIYNYSESLEAFGDGINYN